ncbi:hypothetical protein DSL72_003365 [Monilinia vaccinii-corymbosi]|uniref:Uncharacterized protein n=1 Tax=Monilinia vaccinii-corymbosi TaxID=61207 RepID=A0A8A3NXQ7_9HELO|nr:hypothetical protein DSL72_003365 [Monilinia vaccinii-corymbosi]
MLERQVEEGLFNPAPFRLIATNLLYTTAITTPAFQKKKKYTSSLLPSPSQPTPQPCVKKHAKTTTARAATRTASSAATKSPTAATPGMRNASGADAAARSVWRRPGGKACASNVAITR